MRAPMRIRDSIYDGYVAVVVFVGVDAAVIGRLPYALRRYVEEPAAHEIRARVPAGVRLQDVVDESVAVIAPGMDPEGLVLEAWRRGRSALGVRVLSSGDRVVLAVGHEVMDGGATLELANYLIRTAAGLDDRLDDRPVVLWPVLRGLRTVGRTALKAHRDRVVPELPPLETVPPPSAEDPDRVARARYRMIPVTPALAARVHAVQSAGRSTANTRLASVAVHALRRIYLGVGDVPVAVPVDLRRHVRGRVTGNFIAVEDLGTLLHSDWSPAAITARIGERVRGGTAMVAFARQVAAQAVHRPKRLLPARLRRAPGAGVLSVTVSILNRRDPLPSSAFLPGVQPMLYAATIDRWPAGVTVLIITIGRATTISVWDQSGMFDVDRFEAAIDEELRELERV